MLTFISNFGIILNILYMCVYTAPSLYIINTLIMALSLNRNGKDGKSTMTRDLKAKILREKVKGDECSREG